jgi:glyoxylase-like metal-dependent hydrolase (beta-lactamase superfamily II)
VLADDVALIDAGSGWDQSNADLIKAFETVRDEFGELVKLEDVDRLILTHGHIDHVGGLNFVKDQSDAAIGIHELDSSVIQHFHERLVVSTTNLHLYLDSAGVSEKKTGELIELNKWSKDYFSATPVDFVFDEGPLDGTPFVMHHTPGHCSGQVCVQLDDLLFTADQVLSHTTPIQAPEVIHRYTGLGHYMESLREVRAIPGISLGLGGHEFEMEDLAARVTDTIAFHMKRLEKTLAVCDEPKSISEISHGLFGKQKEYHVLLALLETGAHVEYLHQRGHLVVTNVDEVDEQYNPVLLYAQSGM